MEEDEFPTDWDIEKHNNVEELKDHWKLRKAFIEMYKTKYPEEYLVELSKAYIYSEIYNYIFSAPLMKLLKELSAKVSKEGMVTEIPDVSISKVPKGKKVRKAPKGKN